MDIGCVQKFCAALRWEDAAVFHTEAFEVALNARLRRRARPAAPATADDIMAALAKAKDATLEACRASWVALAKAVQGWSADYASDEFNRYVIQRCRGAECGDYTVTALPRLLELFELQ
jgi:hypothetical protein